MWQQIFIHLKLYIALAFQHLKEKYMTWKMDKLAVYPTILYGVMLEYLGVRKWYTRIDQHVILGALPLKHNYRRIVNDENVKAVLTMNESHELDYSIPRNEWLRIGVEYKQIAVRDYVGVASLDQIKEAITFINKHKALDNCVYVHCKAGRYRSALIVGCYLINSRRFTAVEASSHLKLLRSFVILDKPRQLNAMQSYYEYLYGSKNNY